MDNFIASRVADSRYRSRRIDAFASIVSEERAWYEGSLKRERHTFAETKAAKKEKKEKTDASSSSSGSETDGGTKKDKKKKKKGRCWTGYEPTPGKEPYSEGSCRKA